MPNYQGMFLRGNGNQTIGGVFYTSSANTYTVQQDGIQDHTHNNSGSFLVSQYQTPYDSLSQVYYKSATNLNRPSSQALSATGGVNTARLTTDTRPVNYSVYYYIKT